MNHCVPGDKVYAALGGSKIPALVLESAFSPNGDYEQVRLKVAVKNPFASQWIITKLPRPVQSYKLTRRVVSIPELDGPPATEEEMCAWLLAWGKENGYPEFEFSLPDEISGIVAGTIPAGESAWVENCQDITGAWLRSAVSAAKEEDSDG